MQAGGTRACSWGSLPPQPTTAPRLEPAATSTQGVRRAAWLNSTLFQYPQPTTSPSLDQHDNTLPMISYMLRRSLPPSLSQCVGQSCNRRQPRRAEARTGGGWEGREGRVVVGRGGRPSGKRQPFQQSWNEDGWWWGRTDAGRGEGARAPRGLVVVHRARYLVAASVSVIQL